MKYLYALLILLSLVSCGVETDSSGSLSYSPSDPSDPTDPTDPSDPTDPTDPTDPSDPETDPIFDIVDAEYDEHACSSAYSTASPLQNNAGDERETADNVNGMKILSLYDETTDDIDSNVVMYYNNLSSDISLKDVRSNVYGDNARFIVTYDLVWVTQSDNTVYVKTPKLTNELHSCFRVKLDSEDGSSISSVKVYR